MAAGGPGGPRFRIDLVVSERDTGQVLCVLDTKYKATGLVDPADVAQVVTYAELKGLQRAFLLYPSKQVAPLDAQVGGSGYGP